MIGIVFAFLSSVALSASNLLEKYAVDQMASFSVRRPRQMIRLLAGSPLWMAGFCCGVVGVGLGVIAFALAPIAVVQAILGAGLCLLVFASRLVLHEPIGGREYLGLSVIVVAVILVSLSLSSSAEHGLGRSFLVVLVASGLSGLAAAGLFVGLRRAVAEPGIAFGVAAGVLYGVTTIQMKGASTLVSRDGLLRSIPHIVASPYPYLFALASLAGLFTFQSGLQRCRVSLVGPLASIVAGIYGVAVGMALFREGLPRDAGLSVARLVGFALVLGGTWALAAGPAGAAGAAVVEDRPAAAGPSR